MKHTMSTEIRPAAYRALGLPGLLALLAGLLPAAVLAVPASYHGIHVEVRAEGAVHIARAFYEGGTPVTDGDITVTAPGSDQAWQAGRTDPAGRFVFLPDAEGTWTVQVDDGSGHRARTTVEVAADAVSTSPGAAAHALGHEEETADHAHEHEESVPDEEGGERLWQLLTGLGLIAGISGVAYGITARRRMSGGA
ncbi:MAG: hypothetical protein R6W82_02405 [bacterium]